MASQTEATLLALPLEILLKILSHACTDDGATGRTLMRICKPLREFCFTTGVDIQSIGVDGIRRMNAFVEVLDEREGTRCVKALRLEEPEDEWEERPLPEDPRVQYISILSTIDSSHLLILSLTYPYVYSPTSGTPPYPLLPLLHATPPSDSHSTSPLFPRLLDLTLHGPFQQGSFQYGSLYPNYAPRLKRFALSGYSDLPPHIGHLLSTLFPALEELWLEVMHGFRTEKTEETVLKMSKRFCRVDDQAQAQSSSGGVHIPPNLRLITLVYRPMNTFAKGMNPRLQVYAQHLEEYVRIAERVSSEVAVEIHRFPTYKPERKDSWNHIDPQGTRGWLVEAFGRFLVRQDEDEEVLAVCSHSSSTVLEGSGVWNPAGGMTRLKKRKLVVYPGPLIALRGEMPEVGHAMRRKRKQLWLERRDAILGEN
ncbi:hypothetical protein EIP91_008410 [Steccherinum ochraceum]|uniref:F-box domain-containing protein n=1 Tax=Steccherinum ochraceum TaxID=92696 RepID=A0A4R0R5L3_9APHY|nr:hypothetical protein EIP91_008410 [Steccherinum ochraceum]